MPLARGLTALLSAAAVVMLSLGAPAGGVKDEGTWPGEVARFDCLLLVAQFQALLPYHVGSPKLDEAQKAASEGRELCAKRQQDQARAKLGEALAALGVRTAPSRLAEGYPPSENSQRAIVSDLGSRLPLTTTSAFRPTVPEMLPTTPPRERLEIPLPRRPSAPPTLASR